MEGNETTDSTMESWTREQGNVTSEAGRRGWEDSLVQQEISARRQTECEALHATMPTPDSSFGPYCPRTFDGWSCWNDTPAGTRAYVQCPDFITGFDPQRMGHKDCDANGTWYTHPHTNQSWSNYTTCIDISNLELHQVVTKIYMAGYSMSLVALCISLFIFFFFKSLKCTRVTIHKNLFLSFIINNAMWLVWYECVVNNVDLLASNAVECQVLHVFLHYFLVSNYFWMFCEGLYLHTLLVVAFVAEDRIMKWFYILGWGAPAILTIVYGCSRAADSAQNVHCWMDNGPYNYILSVPVVLSLLLNLFFLVNIVRVLVTKLRAVNTSPDTHSTRKAVRATLILIPLLGLHYILVPFRPPIGSPGEEVYLVVSAVVASFQGLGVSLLFCFFNGEVLGIFKKKWNQYNLMHGGPNSYVGTTFSLSNAAPDLVLWCSAHSRFLLLNSHPAVQALPATCWYMKSSMADGNTTVTNYGTTIEGDDV
ncbi:calcitonin gene-related peptide type 1 receptor isoform X2 [Procambarus clarkii]|uniref:calcitonin gene-related peptide type 1 receptor isoform X2 n=1 Tax=Procambarus clarkii TaxID=6728 RepID=UPI001E670F1E|nr:calcitonin gene-related peptide type 1 receptor-like [Procambarus clarkii]